MFVHFSRGAIVFVLHFSELLNDTLNELFSLSRGTNDGGSVL